jgi:hypothetical protein
MKIDNDETDFDELLAWLDHEIANTVLLVHEEIGGPDYFLKKATEYTNLIKQGEIKKLEAIWEESY